MGALEILALEVEVDPADHDLQVLGHVLLLLFRRRALQLCQHRIGFVPLLVLVSERGLRSLGVELTQPLLRAKLGVVLEDDLDQHVGVLVAGGDPTAIGKLSSLGLREGRQAESGSA